MTALNTNTAWPCHPAQGVLALTHYERRAVSRAVRVIGRARRIMTVGLETFTRAMLEQAVHLYMEEAYGSAPVPAKVRARLAWPAGDSLRQLAAGDAFECVPADVPVDECDRIRLRLGNPQYPHMKLGVDRIPDTGDWVLAVDCHDRQLMAVVQDSERAALEALLRANNELKSRIERQWTDAGLPTFERYIRGRLSRCPRDETGTCRAP